MEKIIFIGLVIIVIILIIKVYEEYVTIQILLNKVRDLDRELYILKNKEMIEELKKELEGETKDDSISIVVGNEIYYEFEMTKKEKQELYESLMEEYEEYFKEKEHETKLV